MEILYALPLGIVLSFAAGPVFFVLIETAISKGRRAAISLDMGAIAADLVFILLAYWGSHSLLEQMKQSLWLGLISGLAVFVFGGYYVLKSRQPLQMTQALEITRKRFFFVKGFLLNFLNIGVFLFWLGTTVTISSLLDNREESMILFYAATMASYLLIDLFKIYFAHRFKERLAGRGLRMIEKVLGLILMAFGFYIILRAAIS